MPKSLSPHVPVAETQALSTIVIPSHVRLGFDSVDQLVSLLPHRVPVHSFATLSWFITISKMTAVSRMSRLLRNDSPPPNQLTPPPCKLIA